MPMVNRDYMKVEALKLESLAYVQVQWAVLAIQYHSVHFLGLII